MSAYEFYDENLKVLHGFGPSLHGGFFNHAPMVVDALCALGHGDEAARWVEIERGSFTARPDAAPAIDPDCWEDSLGDASRYAGWVAFFRDAICEEGWAPVVNLWAGRLADGFTTAACHGWLRTAHAVRALRQAETDTRRDELAEGLACWAAMYTRLPVSGVSPTGGAQPAEALAALPKVPDDHQQGEGFITSGYETLVHAKGFESALNQVDLSGPPEQLSDDLVIAFAGLFLEAAHSEFTAIVFAHAVTGAAALAHALPIVSEEVGRKLLFRAWESGCAFKAAFQDQIVVQRADCDKTPGELAAAIVSHGDDHAIKLGEACLAVYSRRPEPVLLEAVHRFLSIVSPQKSH